ncbi:MAG: sulfite exporter TauE/SafE family protein [Proteobacteria bacterium]|nr:sulfite exporter TauE/SafE family protein [Pseudomonadota bacterium]
MSSLFDDPTFYLVAIIAVTSTGLSKGGFAGVGIIAMPLLSLYAPPLAAAAILLPIQLSQDALSVWNYRRDWDRWNLKVLLPGAAIGVVVAWMLAVRVSDAAVRMLVGVIGLSFVLWVWLGHARAKPRAATLAGGLFWGAVSGFTSTIAQAGGPPFQVHMLPQGLPKLNMVGTNMIFFAALNVMKIVPYLSLGQLSFDSVKISATLLPFAVAANFLGFWLVQRTPQVLFYRIAYVLVFCLSLVLIWRGGQTLFGG